MGGFWQDMRYAGRSLRKAPGFSTVVVFILAIGIGANVAIFSIMDTTLVRSLPYPEPDRLVMGETTFDGYVNPMSSAQDYWDYRDLSTSFSSLAAFTAFTRNHTITGADEPERVSGIIVSVDLFPTLGVGPAAGRGFSADEALEGAPDVVMISYGYWQRRFGGSPDAVGATLVLDGFPYTVVGVMPANFRLVFDVDVWRPMRPDSPFTGARRFHNWLILGRLKPGVTIEAAQSEVDVISAQLAAEYPETNRTKALLLSELQDFLVEDYRTALFLLMGTVGLVLLIACGNVAGLLLARGSARRTELSVRAAIGASGSRLVRQLLTESVALALAAGIAGTVLAVWLERGFIHLLSIDVPGTAAAGISGSVLVFALAISLATGLVFGIAPAFRAAGGNLVEDLKSGGRTTDAGGSRFRGGLVVAQVAISIVLLVGAGLLIRSFATLTGVDPGFRTANLLTAEIRLPGNEYEERERRIQFYTGLVEEVGAIPGVEDVALINQLPIRDPGNNTYVYAAESPPLESDEPTLAFNRTVLPGYFEAMGVPLRSGRDIEASDVEGSPEVIVISEAMADSLFPGQNALGRQVVVDFGEAVTFEVVGVVADVRMTSLRSAPRLTMYSSYRQVPYYTMRIAVRTSIDPGSVAGPLRSAVWSQDRNIPVADLATMEQVMSRSLAGSRTIAIALATFAAVALLLATIGLYGVLAYYVTRRHHEIGIRVALGAEATDIVELVLKRGFALTAAGIVVGLLGAFGATRLLSEMLYNTEPTDPMTFAAVSVFFALVAIVACLMPAWRALRVDPLIALQSE
jgi:predicted permease